MYNERIFDLLQPDGVEDGKALAVREHGTGSQREVFVAGLSEYVTGGALGQWGQWVQWVWRVGGCRRSTRVAHFCCVLHSVATPFAPCVHLGFECLPRRM